MAGLACQVACCLRLSKQRLSNITGSVVAQALLGNTATDTINTPVKKYTDGTFCFNRYTHFTAKNCFRNRKFSTALELHKGSESKDLSLHNNESREIVSQALQSADKGRLFAVVQVAGKQRKVTVEDILIVVGDFYPTIGDKIRLEKVLLVGGTDFTLLGRPVLSRDQVYVEATVIEKTLSQFMVKSWYMKRRNNCGYKLYRQKHTMLVINKIDVNPDMEL